MSRSLVVRAAALVTFISSALAGQATLPLAWEFATPRVLPQAIVRDRAGRPLLYVALKSGGLSVLELAAQGAPKEIARVATTQLAGLDVMHLTQRDTLLYLALGDLFSVSGAYAGAAIVDVANSRAPRVLSTWKSKDRLQGSAAIVVRDRYAYLGAMSRGVIILDVGDPKHIVQAGEFLPDPNFPVKNPNKVQHPNTRGFALRDRLLYVADDAGGLRVLDLANPVQPREVGRHLNPGMGKKQSAYNNLVLDGTTAYVALDYAGMEVLDVSDPARITQVAWWNPWDAASPKNTWFNSPGQTNQIEYDAKRHLIYLSAGDADLLVVDVTDRAHPTLTAWYGASKDKLGVWGVTIDDTNAYLAYMTALVPFVGTWAGIKAVRR